MQKFHNLPVILTSVISEAAEADVPCGDCTRCCEILAPMLTPDEISSGLYPLSFTQPTVDQKLANPGSDIVVTLFRRPEGGCGMFIDGKCSIYERRPQACRQFDCRAGHHPKLVALAQEKFGKYSN